MIDVLERLAELDKDNPNVVNPMVQKEAIAPKKQTPPGKPEGKHLTPSGAIDRDVPTVFRKGKTPADFDKKTEPKKDKVEECGPMGSAYTGPASLSINASAPDAGTITNMLHDLMSLAGVHKVEPEHMPGIDAKNMNVLVEPDKGPVDDIKSIKSMIDSMNDESAKEEVELEDNYDNTPSDPTEVPDDIPRGYQPNLATADIKRGSTDAPRGRYYEETFEGVKSQLLQDYQNFISEEK